MSWSFVRSCTEYMRRPRLGEGKHPNLYPSGGSAIITNQYGEQEVVGACRRATFFRYLPECYDFYADYADYQNLVEQIRREQQPPDQYMLWIWRAGELYEEYLVGLAKESGVFIAAQIPIYLPKYQVSGKLDLITVNPETGMKTITEVKSVYGHNSDHVIGQPTKHRKGVHGTPKDSNLIQIALYHWHFATKRPTEFEQSRLVYGARDTGRFAEYLIDTRKDNNDSKTHIYYTPIEPIDAAEVDSPITIDSILEQFEYVMNHIDTRTIPPRDYELQYSDEKIQQLYERKELGKGDSEKHARRLEQIAENVEREAAGKAPKKLNQPIVKGDWNCRFCNFAHLCYKEDGSPRTDLKI